MVVTTEEEKKTFNYQEKRMQMLKILPVKKGKNWRPIYKVIDNSYFSAKKFQQNYQINVEIIQITLRT